MGWTLVQSVETGGGASATSTLSFLSNNTAGNLLVAWIFSGVNTNGGAGITISGFSDTAGNTYQNPVNMSGNPIGAAQLWYALSCKPGANTLSFSFAGGTPGMVIAEYASSTGATLFDSGATASAVIQGASFGIAQNQLSYTAAQNGELTTFFDSNFDAGSTWTPVAGFTLQTFNQGWLLEDNQNTPAGANTSGGTWGTGRTVLCASVAFQNAASSKQRTLLGAGI